MSILMGLIGLAAACGRSGERAVYRYTETEVLFRDFHIRKTVYTPGEMKLYYRGGGLKDNLIRCYDADFEDLGDEFEYTLKNGVLTVKADFAERISGLMIDDIDRRSVRYHLRYLDSRQFAWMADIFWYDDGWHESGDKEKYYSAEELKEQADKEAAGRQETLDSFAILEGTWVSEDGLQKYVFSMSEDGGSLIAEQMWLDEAEQEWISYNIYAEAAFQSEYYGEMHDRAESLMTITLVNSDHSSANLSVLYDKEKNTIQGEDTTYHRE